MNDREKLEKLITEARNLLHKNVTSSDQDFYKWRLRTERFLKDKFGNYILNLNQIQI